MGYRSCAHLTQTRLAEDSRVFSSTLRRTSVHALGREPGTHPRDALARLAQGGAAPAEPAEPPERVYDDAEDAVDDMGFDSDGFIE